jgi:hypothetical protein
VLGDPLLNLHIIDGGTANHQLAKSGGNLVVLRLVTGSLLGTVALVYILVMRRLFKLAQSESLRLWL